MLTDISDSTESFLRLCSDRNASVRACLEVGDMTLGEYTDLLVEKVYKNRKIMPVRDPDDYAVAAGDYACRLLGPEAGEDVTESVRLGTIMTADHHGALYCAQLFQGDLLFSSLLGKLGYRGKYVPFFSSSQVELGNSTYARGICAYSSPEKRLQYPMYASRQENMMASHAPAFDKNRLDRFRTFLFRNEHDKDLLYALYDIVDRVYDVEDVLKAPRFADQASIVSARLFSHMFQEDDGPVLISLENEELVKPLLIRELYERDSLMWKILYDDSFRKSFAAAKLPDGKPLSVLLFLAADQKGRKIVLKLTEDGSLTGWDRHEKLITYPTDPDSLSVLLKERKLIPGFLVFFLLLTCERGCTWMGGMLQSGYLPLWQQALSRLFRDNGLHHYADVLDSYDCSGYITGPMFIPHRGDGFVTAAGPVEMWMNRPQFSLIQDLMRDTTLYDAHIIGLADMYSYLAHPDERPRGWYRTIAEDLADRFGEDYA